jgi:hypothetical protein
MKVNQADRSQEETLWREAAQRLWRNIIGSFGIIFDIYRTSVSYKQ